MSELIEGLHKWLIDFAKNPSYRKRSDRQSRAAAFKIVRIKFSETDAKLN